jgi:NIMA (never in mitosis gene a)-related kinase
LCLGETTDEDGKKHKGIMHRDLKPANLFLQFKYVKGKRFIIKIGDLGLARSLEDSVVEAQTTAGTKLYMSPESHHGGYQFPHDVWAIGVIMYEVAYIFMLLKKKFTSKTVQNFVRSV